MSTSNVDRWFSDPQLDLSFHFEEAATTEWAPAGAEAQKNSRSSAGKRGTFGQPVFADVPVTESRRLSRALGLDAQYRRELERPRSSERDSRGGDNRPPVPSKQPIEQLGAIDITPDKRRSMLAPRRSPNPRQSALLTIAEFESSSSRPLSSYNSYSSQTTSYPSQPKPLPKHQPSTASSGVSSVTTQKSTTSSNTTLDYSLFTIPPQHLQYTGYQRQGPQSGRGNPQPRPEQLIQQSARRPVNRGVSSPRQASFNTGQKGQKVFRVNSRGAGRRASVKKSQHAPGKPRLVGDVRGMPLSTVGAQRIHVVRPSERPHLVGIPPSHRSPASRRSQYPIIQNTTPTELPAAPAGISITTPPSELAVTSSPQELSAGDFGIPSPQYTPPGTPPARKPASPPPAYSPHRAKTPESRPITPENQSVAIAAAVSRPRSQEDLRLGPEITSKPLPSIPPLVTGWPSWGQGAREETTQKKDEVKETAPPSPTGTTWNPASWKGDEVEVAAKKEEVKAVAKKEEVKVAAKKEEVKVVAKKEEEPKAITHGETEVKTEDTPEGKEVKVKDEEKAEVKIVEPRKMPEIPEALRIGNKQNSSLFERLSCLDAMDILSRY